MFPRLFHIRVKVAYKGQLMRLKVWHLLEAGRRLKKRLKSCLKSQTAFVIHRQLYNLSFV